MPGLLVDGLAVAGCSVGDSLVAVWGGVMLLALSLVVVSRGVGRFSFPAFRSSKVPGGRSHDLLEVFPLLGVQDPTSEQNKLTPE